MNRLPLLVGLLALAAALAVGSGYGQDKQGTAKDAGTPKVQLPAGWGKIGITPDQKKKIYEVIGGYRAKINVLNEQIEKLKAEELSEAYKLLNDDQKAALKKQGDKFRADPGKDKGPGTGTAKDKGPGTGKIKGTAK